MVLIVMLVMLYLLKPYYSAKCLLNPRTKKHANNINDFILASITESMANAQNLSIFSKYSVIVHYTDGDWEEVNI